MLIIVDSANLEKLVDYRIFAEDFSDYRVCCDCNDPGDADYQEVSEIPQSFRQICLPAHYGARLTAAECRKYLAIEAIDFPKLLEDEDRRDAQTTYTAMMTDTLIVEDEDEEVESDV